MHQRSEQPDALFNNLENFLQKTIIDGNKNIIDGAKGLEKSLDRNFDRLHEDISNLVKLMSMGRLPAQPVHYVDENTLEQSSIEHINAITALRSGKIIPKIGDVLKQKMLKRMTKF